MSDGGSKRERRYQESGLTFAWRVPESSRLATCTAVVITALLTVVLLGAVKVRMVPPVRIIERKASVVVVPDSPEGREWTVRAEEEGPFPAKFQLTESAAVGHLRQELFRGAVPGAPYKSHLRDWPGDEGISSSSVAISGERIFPKEALPETDAPPESATPLVPVLAVLTKLPPRSAPATLPEFQGVVPSELAAQNWQFMAEIGPRGRVMQCLALDGGRPGEGVDSLSRDLGNWLCQVRFGPAAANMGWVGLEIHFSRQP